MKHYTHLSILERELIYGYLAQGKSIRDIGRLLNRSHRTISREIKRNQKEEDKRVSYQPSAAQEKAHKRRLKAKVGKSKLSDPLLLSFVIRKLGRGWSPEQISGRLRLIAPDHSISPESIYQYIYKKENRRLRLYEFLRRRHRKRRLRCGRKQQRQHLPGRVFIEERPKEASLRLKIGHWETDNLEGKRKTKGGASALVDRKSLLTRLTKVTSKEAKEKEAAVLKAFNGWPQSLVKTITFDNGKENATHQELAKRLNCQTYFCHAYHSWEKGTVENTLGLVREYLPKGSDLSHVTQGELSWIANELNHRPRKKLDFYTPAEVFEKETGWGT